MLPICLIQRPKNCQELPGSFDTPTSRPLGESTIPGEHATGEGCERKSQPLSRRSHHHGVSANGSVAGGGGTLFYWVFLRSWQSHVLQFGLLVPGERDCWYRPARAREGFSAWFSLGDFQFSELVRRKVFDLIAVAGLVLLAISYDFSTSLYQDKPY